TGTLDGISPQQRGHERIVLGTTRLGTVLLFVGLDKGTANVILDAFRPPEHHGAVDALHDFRTHFFKHVGGQIGHAHLHVFKYAKLVSVLGGVDRIGAVVQVDHDVGTTVGDVQHVGAVVGCAQRVDLCVVDGGPALLFGEGTHVIMDGVTVVVVGHQVDDFQVLAVVFGHDWRNGLGCRVGMVTQAEAIAAAVFSGGITGAADDGEIQGLGALARVLQGNGHG